MSGPRVLELSDGCLHWKNLHGGLPPLVKSVFQVIAFIVSLV
jgi:hypothetical protein